MTEKKRFKSNEDHEEIKATKNKYDKRHYDGSDELISYDDDID